ncbi:MAG: hypothetical protein BMS9Abin07_1990 [Acidimicrobiia bacterium]|nr:MAG: hypothetical protein BMS9Abin07_1990 [Acidimicrobiia bacterium]
MFRRMFRAAALDSDFYDRAEHEPSLNREAFAVVLIASTFAAVGAWIGYDDAVGPGLSEAIRGWLGIGSLMTPSHGGFLVVIATNIVVGVVGWIVWAATTTVVGTRVFGGTTDFGEMSRVLGYAQAPRVIAVVPLLGPVAGVWTLVASVIAIRQGLDFDTPRAVGSAIGGWLVWMLVQFGVSIIGASLF